MRMNFLRKNINWVCHHAHLDKSNIINKDLLIQSNRHMREKWYLMDTIKQNYTREDLSNRIEQSIIKIVSQNCKHIRTFVDVDKVVGLMCIEETEKLKRKWKAKGITIQTATQPLQGIVGSNENLKLFEKATKITDIVGCLPSRDYNNFDEHLDIAFSTAKRLNKPLEAHLDQLNIPVENETEIFCNFVEKYEYQGKARSVHSVSLSCKPLEKQIEIAQRLKELDIGIIVCPSAAISMMQDNKYKAPIHNSIAPVQILYDNGVNIGLGIDNINDLFMPLCDGDLHFELRLLAEATRIYNINILEQIAENKMGF
uniref:Amidohydrolase-related domain-containing protein n=1 Tax=viral metagenome TaxID=1070528 RepID=A0A6C0KYL1_9ZZZZ